MDIDTKIFGKDFSLYKKSLDTFAQRHLIISSNIANVDTPGYKAKDLEFGDYLKSIVEPQNRKMELARTNERHIQKPTPYQPKPRVFYEMRSFGPDGNSVDIDNEMVKLNENLLRYRISSNFIAGKFNSLRNAIERLRP